MNIERNKEYIYHTRISKDTPPPGGHYDIIIDVIIIIIIKVYYELHIYLFILYIYYI